MYSENLDLGQEVFVIRGIFINRMRGFGIMILIFVGRGFLFEYLIFWVQD